MTPAPRIPRVRSGRASHFALLALTVVLATTACRDTFYPLKNRITPGTDPFVVFVADGPSGGADLYAGQGSGGNVFQVTYTLADEDAPALSRSGGVLAFLRAPHAADSAQRQIWFMNLTTGNEREIPLLPEGVVPVALAFSDDEQRLFVRTTTGLWALAVPPSAAAPHRLSGPDSLIADSALAVWLGEPRFALIAPCVVATGSICAFPPGTTETPLQEGGVDPVHWGADSVGYFVGDRMIVRAGIGGRPREVQWTRIPKHPRRPTFAPPAPPAARR